MRPISSWQRLEGSGVEQNLDLWSVDPQCVGPAAPEDIIMAPPKDFLISHTDSV